MRSIIITIAAAALIVAGCGEQEPSHSSTPLPVEITRDHIGYYCNMIVVDHVGPKGQVHIKGRADPVWFSSVRDTIVFTLLPEEPKNVAAIYVNDMGRATWDTPEAGTWIDAREAWFVIGSEKRGGMGAPEAVPFSKKADAEAFAGAHGGRVVAFDGVPRDYVLNDGSQSMQAGMHGGAGGMHQVSHTGSTRPGSKGHGQGHDQDHGQGHAHGAGHGEATQ